MVKDYQTSPRTPSKKFGKRCGQMQKIKALCKWHSFGREDVIFAIELILFDE